MKTLGLALLVLGVALAAVPASAQSGGSTSFTLQGHTDGSTSYWTSAGSTDHNPTLTVPAGATITVTVSSAAGTHQFKVGDQASSAILSEGDAPVTYTFTAPQSGSVKYECPIHSTDMFGNFVVAGSSVTPTKKSPGTQVVGAVLALAGAALVVASRRRE